jgi:hypothetical protein
MEADLAYYQRRSREEAAAAAAAEHQGVRAAHLELRRRYEERIAGLGAEQRRSEIHLISAA